LGPKLILEEVQRAPELLSAVKLAVDRDRPRRPGRFVLTGRSWPGQGDVILMKPFSGRAWGFVRSQWAVVGCAIVLRIGCGMGRCSGS
jgi:hypothetical protein